MHKIYLLILALIFLPACGKRHQRVSLTRPSDTVERRTKRPSTDHEWVSGKWVRDIVLDNGRYLWIWHPGQWKLKSGSRTNIHESKENFSH